MMPASSTPFIPGMMTSENTSSAENSSSARIASAAPALSDPANGVSQILQQLGRELPDFVIVFDHEDTIAAAGGGGLAVGGSGFRRIVRHGGLRQIDGESRALSECAGDLDVAIGLLGKAERLAEAEACSLADLLGREERLEDCVNMIGRNAGAGVGNGDGDEVAAARGLGAQGRDGVDLLDC